MSHSPIGWRPLIAGVILTIALGCESAPQQKSAPGNIPGQMPMTQEPRVTATTYLAHGHLLERQGQFERAVVQYQKALRMQPDFVTARNRLGITLNKLGRHTEASEQFRQALRYQADKPFLYNNLGFSLYLEGQYEKANAALEDALRLKSEYARAHMNHALVLAKLNRFDEVASELAQACDPPDANYNMGILLTEAQRYADAACYLERALTLRPNFEAARLQLHEVGRLAAEWEAYQAAHALAADVEQDAPAEEPQPAVSNEPAASTGTEAPTNKVEPTSAEEPAVALETPSEMPTPTAETDESKEAEAAPTQSEIETVSPTIEDDAEPCDEDDPETNPAAWQADQEWLAQLAANEDWTWLDILVDAPRQSRETSFPSPPAAWKQRPEARTAIVASDSQASVDPQRLAAMIDELTRAWQDGYREEFDQLWCRLGYYIFPETAPTAQQPPLERLRNQSNTPEQPEPALAK